MDPSLGRTRLESLRRGRVRPEPDQSLAFLQDHFKREVAKPYKQLGELSEHWQRLVPSALAKHTKLDSFSRGVLLVSVSDSARLYELDHLLRSGLERQIFEAHRGPSLRRIKLRVGPVA